MICKTCGAAYDERLDHCPYCQSENDVKINRIMQKELNDIKEERETIIKRLPKFFSNFWGVIFFVIILGIGFFLLLIFFLNQNGCSTESIKKKSFEKHSSKLDKMLEEKEYEEITDYLYKKNLYGTEYKKYMEVSDVYTSYDLMLRDFEYLSSINEDSGNITIEDKKTQISNMINSACFALNYSYRYMNDDIPRRNEEYLEEMYEEILFILQEDFDFTDEECEEIVNHKEITTSYHKKYVDRIYEKYFE